LKIAGKTTNHEKEIKKKWDGGGGENEKSSNLSVGWRGGVAKKRPGEAKFKGIALQISQETSTPVEILQKAHYNH